MEQEQRKIIPPTCPYCGQSAKLVGGEYLYSHRPDLYHLRFWLCDDCCAWAGVHRNSPTYRPKGRLANEALRRLRTRAHRAFDPLWKSGRKTRAEAYRWLQEALDTPYKPHIGFMDERECKRVIEVCDVLPD